MVLMDQSIFVWVQCVQSNCYLKYRFKGHIPYFWTQATLKRLLSFRCNYALQFCFALGLNTMLCGNYLGL